MIRGSLSNSNVELKQIKSRSLSQLAHIFHQHSLRAYRHPQQDTGEKCGLISFDDLDQVPRHRLGVVGGAENAGELYRRID